MATTCPHGCSRCRLIEAGHDPSHGLSQRQFVEIFGVIEREPERAPLAEDTLEAIAAEEAARTQLEQAEGDVNGLIFSKGKHRENHEFEEALRAATTERTEAGERHHAARLRMRALVRRDQEMWDAERGAARRAELATQREAERARERKRGRRLLGKFRGS